jgi:hypothetical protein
MTAAVVVDTTLGELLWELLSPSQVNTFLACPAKWYFLRSDLWSRRPERWRWAARFIPCWRSTSGRRSKPGRIS